MIYPTDEELDEAFPGTNSGPKGSSSDQPWRTWFIYYCRLEEDACICRREFKKAFQWKARREMHEYLKTCYENNCTFYRKYPSQIPKFQKEMFKSLS